MWNIKNLGDETYRAAEPLKQQTLPEFIRFVKDVFFDVITCLGLFVPVLLRWVKGLILTKKPKKINGKVALVTGGGNGLGRLIAFRLAQEKCNIAIADLDIAGAQRTAEEVKSLYNVQSKGYQCDVSNHEDVEKLRKQIKNDLGTVTILVNNAGVIPAASFRERHWSDIEKQFKININSHIWTTRIFLDDMIAEKDGHIVAISSMAGIITAPFMASYVASKHAVNAFMGSLRDEMVIEGHDYIKSTTVCPYFINTRKNYMEFVNLRFPPLEPEYVANKLVDGMLVDKEFFYIIKLGWIVALAVHLPNSVKRIVSEVIFKAKDVRNLDYF